MEGGNVSPETTNQNTQVHHDQVKVEHNGTEIGGVREIAGIDQATLASMLSHSV